MVLAFLTFVCAQPATHNASKAASSIGESIFTSRFNSAVQRDVRFFLLADSHGADLIRRNLPASRDGERHEMQRDADREKNSKKTRKING